MHEARLPDASITFEDYTDGFGDCGGAFVLNGTAQGGAAGRGGPILRFLPGGALTAAAGLRAGNGETSENKNWVFENGDLFIAHDGK